MTTRSKTHTPRKTPSRQQKSVDKMRRYRKRLRAAGLRPVQIWIPDIHAPGFAAEARRQSLAVSKTTDEREAIEFIEAAGDFSGWE
jgi:hypothetical protein